ncbi:MAG: alpha-hydroxy acid oxidase [Defluviicoccus sp.]|nr:alpha-hydroxy acid oxidase [Defluviicoccus sp.]
MSERFETTHEIVRAARASVSQPVWNYITGAAETETTMRRNRRALDCIAFRPRVLRDVSDIDVSGSLLGHNLRIPVLLAPIGSLQTIVPDGAIAVARAAAAFGTLQMVSTVTQPGLEEIADSVDHPKIFQIYIRGDEHWIRDLVARARDAGYAALALTVDSAHYGRRERQLLTRWLPPSVRTQTGREWQARITWETMAMMKEHGGLPFILKGIQTAEDAEMAVEHGIDVVYVSNHGGRQLDHGQGTVDILREVVAAVDGRAEIVLDSGIARGTDVLKALALGADAVAIGRLQAWALAVGGTATLIRALEILEAEMHNAMGLIGVTSLAELNPRYVTEAPAVTEATELGAFPLLGEEIRL